MCLNKNLKHDLPNGLGSKEALILKLGLLREYYVKNLFIEKCAQNVHQQLVPDQYII